MPPRARSLVMDLFGEYLRFAGGEVRPPALIALLDVFGVEATTTRMTLSRMKRDGWFTTHRAGGETVYALTEHMEQVLAEGRERIFTRAEQEWDGTWTQLIYQVPESARATRESLRKQLTWLGFGQFAPSTWFSPHPVADGVRGLRTEFPDASIDVLRSRTTDLTGDRDLAARCWDLAEVATAYRDFLRTYARLDDGSSPDGAEALRLRTLLAADARRLAFRDPHLPAALLPADWPGRAAFELFGRVHDRLAPAATAYVESLVGRPVPVM